MSYEIIFSASAYKELSKLERKDQERIVSALERLRIRPERYVSKLVGDPAYRLRVGQYRVLMDINEGKLMILVIKVGHRKIINK